MDLCFMPNRGKAFYMEVGYFDTVIEIKENIEKHHGILASRQTLIFNNNVLRDELNVHNSEILDRSRIQLLIAPDPSASKNDNDDDGDSSPSSKIRLVLKMPASEVGITVAMDVNENVRGLKEKIQEMENVPMSKLAIHANGVELHDQQSVRDCHLGDASELDVVVQSSPTSTNSSESTGTVTSRCGQKLKIVVVSKCGTKKVPLRVNSWDTVVVLRKKLMKVNEKLELDLPKEGYFFIYKQNVMDDDRTFRWHQVRQGDTIEIFNGSVSSGS